MTKFCVGKFWAPNNLNTLLHWQIKMLTAILKQFTENQKKLPVFNTILQLQRTYLRGWWMTVGLVTWRESCVGTGFSWKLCTASAGKSAWPLTGAPEIVNDLGGLETMWTLMISLVQKQTPNKCTDHPSIKEPFIVLCPIQKPNNPNVLYKLWSYPSCYLGSHSSVENIWTYEDDAENFMMKTQNISTLTQNS